MCRYMFFNVYASRRCIHFGLIQQDLPIKAI